MLLSSAWLKSSNSCTLSGHIDTPHLSFHVSHVLHTLLLFRSSKLIRLLLILCVLAKFALANNLSNLAFFSDFDMGLLPKLMVHSMCFDGKKIVSFLKLEVGVRMLLFIIK